MKQCKIITAYDDEYRSIGAICSKSIQMYAALQDAAHQTYLNISSDRAPAWTKIKLLMEEIRSGQHEFILWVDADACFVRGDKDILSNVVPGKDIYVVNPAVRVAIIPEWSGTFIYRERPNTGVMLLRSSQWALDFLQTLWDTPLYRDHPWWENAAFLDLIGYRNEITEGVQQNEPNLEKIQWLSGEWNSIPTLNDGEPAAVAQDPVIVHFAGMPNKERLVEMNKLYFKASHLGER